MKHFEISVLRHIRFAELRKTINPTTTVNRMNLKFDSQVRDILKYCGKEEKLLLRSNFSSFPQYFVPVGRSLVDCW